MATFQGPTMTFGGGVSDTFTTPFPHALGTKARDAAGNEYVLCQTGAVTTVSPEQVVVIGADWSITPIGAVGAFGMLGVVPDYDRLGLTSARVSPYPINTALWIQIYGRAYIMYDTPTGVASSGGALTTVRTSLAYRFHVHSSAATTPTGQPYATSADALSTLSDYLIVGMTVATDASPDASIGLVTLVSATHSGSDVAVWLNYPYARYIEPAVSTA